MWVFVVLLVIVVAAAVLFPPKITTTDVDQEAFEAPTAKEGLAIPVIFGTVDIRSPNVVWYGDTRAVAIRKKGGKK